MTTPQQKPEIRNWRRWRGHGSLDRRVLRRMHPGKKHAITYDFRGGETMLGCARKWKLRITVIEQIIREHIR